MPRRLPGDRPTVPSAPKNVRHPQCCLIHAPCDHEFTRSKPSASGFSEDGPQVAARPPYRSASVGAWRGPPGVLHSDDCWPPTKCTPPPSATCFSEGGVRIAARPPYRSPLPAFSPMTSEHVTGHPPNRHEGVPPNHKTPSQYLLCTGRSTRHKTRERFCSGWLWVGSTTRGRLDPRPLHGWVEPWHYGTP